MTDTPPHDLGPADLDDVLDINGDPEPPPDDIILENGQPI